jgi:replicative DNA helicase
VTSPCDVVYLDDLLQEEDPEHDWVIPQVIEREERAIVVGRGGVGKSTLLRQVAVMGASGLHPFTEEKVPPIRVTLVDLENRRRKIRQKMRTLVTLAGDLYQEKTVVVALRASGMSFASEADLEWLTKLVMASHPDLLVIGPLYKMGRGDPNTEEFAQPIISALDDLLVRFHFGLIIEAHPPYGNSSTAVRRPAGTAIWERWPDYGYHLDGKGHLTEYRPPRGDGVWPGYLRRGAAWPWETVTDPREVLFQLITEAAEFLGTKPSMADLASQLEVSKLQIQRCIGKGAPYYDRWDRFETNGDIFFRPPDD